MKRLVYIFCILLSMVGNIRVSAKDMYDAEVSDILVQGAVIDMATQKPLAGVSIVRNGLRIAVTDSDGFYSITVPADATLFFYATGYNGYKTVVNNRQVINVSMSEIVLALGEAIVVGQMSRKTIVVDQADLEVVGNYLHLKTKFRVPKHVFRPQRRFIVQPTLHNVSKNKSLFFRPVVMDGKIYALENERMLESYEELEGDPLAPYTVENDLDKTQYIYSYHDSLFVARDEMDNDYRAECFLSVNGVYEKPKRDYRDTVVIAKGTVNPLRFFRYDILPLELNDTSLIPRPRLELISSKGVSRVNFLVGKAVIDENDSTSVAELNAVSSRVDSILGNKYATLQGVSVTGYASPEGNYSSNRVLAGKRTALILDKVTRTIPSGIRDGLALANKSVVLPWSEVARQMEDDSLPQASKVRMVVTRYMDDFPRCQSAIKSMPEYDTLIARKYLPRLRRVEYEIDYSVFRNLTDREIKEKYDSGSRDLTRHEWWRLIETAPDEATRIRLERMSLKSYPDFTLVANREAVRLIRDRKPDMNVLAPCVKDGCPFEVTFNHALACLASGEVKVADSLVQNLPADPRIDLLQAVIDVENGYFEKAYPMFASMGGLNEVLLLMCLKRDKEAYEAASRLLEDPVNKQDPQVWYVLAACANRLDDLGTAMDALQCAVNLNPRLKEIARVDSDVMDIMDILEPKDE
ncbi:MAG: carboxypeptidase-like regulatory domain-containing protein [Candidatus Cryptobacteroides sp.]